MVLLARWKVLVIVLLRCFDHDLRGSAESYRSWIVMTSGSPGHLLVSSRSSGQVDRSEQAAVGRSRLPRPRPGRGANTAMILSSASPLVEHLQPADHPGAEQDVGAVDRPLGDDADVKRIAVASYRPWTQGRHSLGAVGPGNEAVEGGWGRRGLLGSVDLEVPGRLVHLVLDHVEGGDFDVGGDEQTAVRGPKPSRARDAAATR